MTMRTVLLSLAICALAAPLAAQQAEAPVGTVASSAITGMINVSLHNTTAGMGYFCAKDNGGFENFTGISYTKLACKGCHAAPAVRMYNDSGYVNLLTWNKETGKREHMSGVIPVPKDWPTAFKIDFVARENDTGAWIFQQHGPSENGTQMIIGEPLTKMPKM